MKLAAPVYADGLRKQTQMRFGGYEALGTEGGLRDMENLTSDFWPELASRPKRKKVRTVTDPRGIAAGPAAPIWADGRDLHYRNATVQDLLQNQAGVRTFAVLGDYITVWPDKVYYDAGGGTHGNLGAAMTPQQAYFCSAPAPSGISDTANCITLHGYDSSGMPFRAGDAVEISLCTGNYKNNQTIILRELAFNSSDSTWNLYTLDDGIYNTKKKGWTAPEDYPVGTVFTWLDAGGGGGDLSPYYFTAPIAILEGYNVLLYRQANGTPSYVRIEGGNQTAVAAYDDVVPPEWVSISFNDEDDEDYTEYGIRIERAIPDLDFVFYHENRLIGCRKDTIYVSKLGDPFNWNVYDGIASDSWTTETGTRGSFTGACSYAGCPRFFKENYVITMYGDHPAEYELHIEEQMGVQDGSGRSLCVVDSRLFYLGTKGPCVYTGDSPRLIAESFGVDYYKNGCGGGNDIKYFLSMQDKAGAWHLFSFDTRRWLWLREDGLHAMSFAHIGGDCWCEDTSGILWILGRAVDPPDGATDEGTISWMAEFGDIAQRAPNHKRITKVQFRLEMEAETSAVVKIKYDSENEWKTVATVTAPRKKSAVVPLIPRRLDHFRLKVEGTGSCRISSLAIETAQGSDRR